MPQAHSKARTDVAKTLVCRSTPVYRLLGFTAAGLALGSKATPSASFHALLPSGWGLPPSSSPKVGGVLEAVSCLPSVVPEAEPLGIGLAVVGLGPALDFTVAGLVLDFKSEAWT